MRKRTIRVCDNDDNTTIRSNTVNNYQRDDKKSAAAMLYWTQSRAQGTPRRIVNDQRAWWGENLEKLREATKTGSSSPRGRAL